MTTRPWDRLDIFLFAFLYCCLDLRVFAVADGRGLHSYVVQASQHALMCFTKSALILVIQHLITDQGNRFLAGPISDRLCNILSGKKP